MESEHNKAVEATELTLWAEQPDNFSAYYDLVSDHTSPKPYRASFRTHGTITTWLGTQIGVVTEARVYPHNFGARMVSVKVQGDNGASYHGRASYDNGNCIVLRKSKTVEPTVKRRVR